MADIYIYICISVEHHKMHTLQEISLDVLDVHLVSGSASSPEPEISAGAWGTTLKSNSLSVL